MTATAPESAPADSPHKGLTREELLNLPAAVDLVTAGRAFGIGRSKAYELAARDEFPVRLLRLGNQYRAVTAEILACLGVTAD